MIALIGGSGRCGTTSVALFLDGHCARAGGRIAARHQTRFDEIADLCLEGRADDIDDMLRTFRHAVEVSPIVPFLPRRPLVDVALHGVVRDGRDVVPSGMDIGWGTVPVGSNDRWVRIHPFPGRTQFERCCQQWEWTNRRLIDWGARMWRLEDLATDGEARIEFVRAFDLEPSEKPFPRANDRLEQTGHPPVFPSWPRWSRRQMAVFARTCGKLMDELYPSWRMDSATTRPDLERAVSAAS
jgi:hypothetical protein